MNSEAKEITVRKLTEGYEDRPECGVVGCGGSLDIRPPFQREFIYGDKQRDAIIDTIMKGLPFDAMYWAVRKDGGFEVIDGQQRTISICQFVTGVFALNGRYFHDLDKEERDKFLAYRLMVYLCSGDDSEKVSYFRIMNIGPEALTDQELRNAIYAGSWVSDARRYFSKTACPALEIGGDYLSGSPIRQDFLEAAIDWLSKGNINGYMVKQQHKPHANELWLYFRSVISWVQTTFPRYRKEMKGIAWGKLYNIHKDGETSSSKLEMRIGQLMSNENVTNKQGIYGYVLSGSERYLNARSLSYKPKGRGSFA